MKNKRYWFLICLFFVGIFIFQSCKTYTFRNNYKEVNALLHDSDSIQSKLFLKAHLKNGDVCIFQNTWQFDSINQIVFGKGTQYDFNRNQVYDGTLRISIDSVSIFETNEKLYGTEKGRIISLSILTGVEVALTVVCITNPKICFGSCPTFYINENENLYYADAEGFSNAILPSLEYADIDALNNSNINDSVFKITMKNEALETHCINEIKLFAFPRIHDERIYQSKDDAFFLCKNIYALNNAESNEGNITSLLQFQDKQERFSLTDSHNLNSKEEIYLTFNHIDDTENLGLVVNFRQTLLTTYLIYNAIGYMGDEVVDFFSALESNHDSQTPNNETIKNVLGNIDIYIWDEQKNKWVFQSALHETGPIAINHQIVPLNIKNSSKEIKVKIVLNKGLWRIDYLALTNIQKEVQPIIISPKTVYNKGVSDSLALTLLESTKDYLNSMPGDEFQFVFNMPADSVEYELFLYSKGYYIEWMREYWLQEKDLMKLRLLVENPSRYLRKEAQAYKQYEGEMEQEFWNSKIDTKNFSYYEK